MNPFKRFQNLLLNPRAQTLFFIFAFAFPLFFYRLGSWAFFDADEGRYGAIPREMVVNGDFITPTLNHIKFFDKPPLLYWGIAGAYKAFGFHEWAARLIPALAALAGVLSAYTLGRRMFGERAGRWSAIILSTCLMWPLLARVVVTDMLVSSLLFISLALWWLGNTEAVARKQTLYFLGFWSVLGLAVLAKGPVTIVLAGGSIFLYCMIARQWESLRIMRWVPGLVLCFAIAAPWFVLVAIRNPEFNGYFWYDQHIARFSGKSISGADHIEGRDYYFKLLPIIFFPWTFFILGALDVAVRFLKKPDSPRRRAGVFLLSGVFFILLFFNITSSKLITYLLPILPLTAILLGAYFDHLATRESEKNSYHAVWASAWLLAGLLVIASGAAWKMGAPKLTELGASNFSIAATCVVIGVWGVALFAAASRRRARELVAATAGGFTLVFVCALFLISQVAPQFTTPKLIAYIQPGITAGAEVDTLPFTQSVGFYARRRVEMLGLPSELAFGIRQMTPAERKYWVTDDKLGTESRRHLERDLRLATPVYFVIRKNKINAAVLASLPAEATKIIENKRFVIVGNKAAVALTPPSQSEKSRLTSSVAQ